MKIQHHPRTKDIVIGDEVLYYRNRLYAQVEEIFPAAVCVKLLLFNHRQRRFEVVPQLWRVEDIENLSVCRYCGGRHDLHMELVAGIPSRVCDTCRTVLEWTYSDSVLASTDQQG
jgi:thymidine kinase